MKEEEAKTKVCHKTLVRPFEEFPWVCLDSACMAWGPLSSVSKEIVYNQPEPPAGEGWSPYSNSPTNVAWVREHPPISMGFCGLVHQIGD